MASTATAEPKVSFVDRLIGWAGALSQNVVLNVIQRSFMLIFPFMMIGSIFSLIAGFPNDGWTEFLAANGLDAILQIPVQYTTEFISIYLVFAVAYFFSTMKGNKQGAISNGLIALFAFVVMIPYMVEGEGFQAVTSIPFTYTGARGMFIALFVGFGVAALCNFAKDHHWTIKMPDSVFPEGEVEHYIDAIASTLGAPWKPPFRPDFHPSQNRRSTCVYVTFTQVERPDEIHV